MVWPIAAWFFIALMPFVPGSVGPVKAFCAAAAFGVPSAIAAAFIDKQIGGVSGWVFITAELALMFIAIAVVVDYSAVRRSGMGLRQLGELYNITSVQVAVAYFAPLGGLLLTVTQQVAFGNAAFALSELAHGASSFVPPGR